MDQRSRRQLPAALPDTEIERVLEAGSHAVGERFLIAFEGTGAAQLGDPRLTLTVDEVTLERTANFRELANCGYIGQWTARRPPGPVAWMIDGCVTELVAGDGAVWMSALSLRSARDRLDWTGALAAKLRPVAQSAVQPPSTNKLVPVTSADASEAR